MRRGNIFASVPDPASEEIFETLVQSGRVRVERIISDAHASPGGFWYDQDQSEFVLLLKGSAGLKFEGRDEVAVLTPGDWIYIPAHLKHRVEWTDSGEKTVWFAVFY
jgi:cupin 2 domain-containing protein